MISLKKVFFLITAGLGTLSAMDIDQTSPLLERGIPREIWQTIADHLPGNSHLLNSLGRTLKFDQATYEKIVEALIEAIEDFPLKSEVKKFMETYFKTAYSPEITRMIEKALADIIQNHELSDYGPNRADIELLDRGGHNTLIHPLRGAMQPFQSSNGLHHNLLFPLNRDDRKNLSQFPLFHPFDPILRQNSEVANLNPEELNKKKQDSKKASINVRYILKLIDLMSLKEKVGMYAYILPTYIPESAIASTITRKFGNRLLLTLYMASGFIAYNLLLLHLNPAKYYLSPLALLGKLLASCRIVVPISIRKALLCTAGLHFLTALQVSTSGPSGWRQLTPYDIKLKYQQIQNQLTNLRKALDERENHPKAFSVIL